MCSIKYKAFSTCTVLANIPIQDTQDSVTGEQLPIAAACETHSSTCNTSAWSTFSPLRFCLWCTVSPNDDNDKLGQLPKEYFSKSSHTQGRAGGQSPVRVSPLPGTSPNTLYPATFSSQQVAICLETNGSLGLHQSLLL